MIETGYGLRMILACAVLPLVLIGCARGKGEVTVLNQTGKAFLDGRLVLGSQTFDLGGVKPGESRNFSFSSAEASHRGYRLALTLTDQSQTLVEIGSIQSGSDYHDALTVGKTTLTLDSSQNSAGNRNLFSKGSQTLKLKWFY